LNIQQSGAASHAEKSRQNQFGISSGPPAFVDSNGQVSVYAAGRQVRRPVAFAGDFGRVATGWPKSIVSRYRIVINRIKACQLNYIFFGQLKVLNN